jgi:hypothetical protein
MKGLDGVLLLLLLNLNLLDAVAGLLNPFREVIEVGEFIILLLVGSVDARDLATLIIIDFDFYFTWKIDSLLPLNLEVAGGLD